MADFSALKTSIQNYIKQNGNNEITGAILQQILLSMVTALGDNAINDLVTALGDEVSARQNVDGTLQENIDDEAAARQNADGTLQQNINNEAAARGNADTQLGNRITTLQGTVNGIIANIENGYVYAGIATPSTTPESGKVFYLALTAGTYTNFGATVVPQGINILKYNGSAWSLDRFLGLDNAPTQGSDNLAKSGGIYNAIQNAVNVEKERALQAESILQQNINNEKTRAINAENNLHDEVLVEKKERKQEIVGVRNDVLNLIHDYQPIVVEGNVVNAPDEEDLTQEPNNLLKFKDKAYNPTIFSGLGRKYLRRNVLINEDYISFDGFVINPQAEDVLDGSPDAILWDRLRERFVAQKDEIYYLDWQGSSIYIPVNENKIYVNENIPYFWNGEDLAVDDNVIERYGNKLTQDMLTEENTIYIIQYDYTLDEDITIPANCILEFAGGSINGTDTLTFANTFLTGNTKVLCPVSGTISNDSITPKDFGAAGDGVTDDTKAIRSAIDVCDNIHITSGIYIISPNSGYGYNDGLCIKRSNVLIKMDSDAVLKAAEIPLETLSYFRNILTIYGAGVVDGIDTRIENITIEGGNIIGSRSQYNLQSTDNKGENYCGIGIWFCNNVTIKNCTITDCAGDAIYTAAVDNLIVEKVSATRFRRGGVSVGLNNGVLIRECNFDRPASITYSNGNVSYPTGTPFTICFEPEPAFLRAISDKPIQNVIIEDNTFIGEATFTSSKYIEGCVSGITIRRNIFKNSPADGILLQPLSSAYGSNGVCENALIEENTIEGIVYSAGSKANYRSINAECNGNITIRNNKVSNMMLATAKEYTTLIIENNETTGWEYFAIANTSIEGSTPKAYIKGNISEATCVLTIYGNSVQDVYINDNILSGIANILDGTNTFCYIGYNSSNVYIENNKATIHGEFIVTKRFNNTGKLLLKGNYFDCQPTNVFLVFDMNGNKRYVNADIIDNYIRTTVNATLSVSDFTGKMSVINNVFGGNETKFTTDTTDTEYLKTAGNIYLGY